MKNLDLHHLQLMNIIDIPIGIPIEKSFTTIYQCSKTQLRGKKTLSGYLVGGFNHLEKYEFVNGKDDIPYMKWTNIKAMFETTNEYINH